MSHAAGEVVVVGGGPVGALLAILLRQRGHEVTVYEHRPDFRSGEREAGRSINLVVTRRGFRALERVGLAEAVRALTVPVTGRMVHSHGGATAFQPYGRDESECNHSVSRAGLNEFLVQEAEGRGVRFRFRTRLVDADPPAGRLAFQDLGTGERVEVRAPVTFGADGAGSAVRQALARLPGFEESVEMLGHGYKELTMPSAPGGGFRIAGHALHIWPRGDFMLMALPNPDGSCTATLYLPWRGEHGFESVDTPHRVERLFEEHFPDAIPLVPDLAEAFLANPAGSLGTVRCRPWHLRDRVMLVGDAAHAIVPFFGQGMNAGFEDCTVLGELLEENGPGDWGGVFEELDRLRKPNADAIAEMALENFVEMRDRVGDAGFALRKRVEHRLELEMPRDYRSRYSMVMYSHIPFRICLEAGRIQQGILDELCAGRESEEGLDLDLARRLVGERLTPLLRQRGVSLDY